MTHIPPDYAKSPVFDQASRPHAGLERSASSWGMGAAVVGPCVLGVITFVSLSNHRAARQAPPPQDEAERSRPGCGCDAWSNTGLLA